MQLPEDAALRKIAEGIKSETGERFSSSLVRHLASVPNCQYAFVSELSKDRLRFRESELFGHEKGSFTGATEKRTAASSSLTAGLYSSMRSAKYPPRCS